MLTIPHPVVRNTVLPAMYLIYWLNLRTGGAYEKYYKPGHYFLVLFSPFTYILLVQATWEYAASPVQYYLTYLLSVYLLRSRSWSTRVTQSVNILATIGYLYEVPKWLGISVFEVIRSSQYTLIEWGFMSAVIFFLYYAEYRLNLETVSTLSIYILYCLIYMTHLKWLWWTAHYLHIPPVVFKRLPATLLVLALTQDHNWNPRPEESE